MGIPPLYGLAKRLGGEAFCCVLGFNRASEIFYAEEFAQYGKVVLTTADGSAGVRGFVDDALRQLDYDYYFACGPEARLRAVHALGKEGQLSFEARMGLQLARAWAARAKRSRGPSAFAWTGP